jgi:hypothetical protein
MCGEYSTILFVTKCLLLGLTPEFGDNNLIQRVLPYNHAYDGLIGVTADGRLSYGRIAENMSLRFDDVSGLVETYYEYITANVTLDGSESHLVLPVAKQFFAASPRTIAYLGGQVLFTWCFVLNSFIDDTRLRDPHHLKQLRTTAIDWLPKINNYYTEYLSQCGDAFSGASVPIDNHGKYENLTTRRQRYEFMKVLDKSYNPCPYKPYKVGYCSCRLGHVPKDLDNIRTITPVSLRMKADTHYQSRALKYALEKSLPQHFTFYDQTTQWKRLMIGWRSADASSASDLIDCFQVVACFPSLWKMLLQRRPTVVEVGTAFYTVCMYGAMGHDLTFPVETAVFVVAAISCALFMCTYYGDDGTFKPVKNLEQKVERMYNTFGWKLNKKKSFLGENQNAEACGVYRFGNRFSKMFRWSRGMTPDLNQENVTSAIAMQHCAYANGFAKTDEYLTTCLTRLGITKASSRSPYCIWADDAPSYLLQEKDGLYIVETTLRMHYPAASKVDLSFFDEYKYYMLRQVPESFGVLDASKRVNVDWSQVTYIPLYDKPRLDSDGKKLKDLFIFEDEYAASTDLDNNGVVEIPYQFRGPISYDSLVQTGGLVLEQRKIEKLDDRFVNSDMFLDLPKELASNISIN